MKRNTGVVLLAEQALHETGAHPENSRRLPPVIERLRGSPEWPQLHVLEPKAAEFTDLLRVHSEPQVELVRDSVRNAPTWIDGDTPVGPSSLEVALKAAGAGMTAVDAVATGEADGPASLFALIRPPGHHATTDRAMGFCLFNNAAVAARYARDRYGLERVAILDWDVHHGNGTQDIFWSDPATLFISLHQWPLYPGSGWLDEVGAGDGRGFTVNLPMSPGSGDREHLEAMDRIVEPLIEAYRPELLIVSAGQDGHAADQLASQMITAEGYMLLAERSAVMADRLGIGLVALHEGGYNLETLPQLDHSVLAGLGGYEVDLEEPFSLSGAGSAAWKERLEEILGVQRQFWDL